MQEQMPQEELGSTLSLRDRNLFQIMLAEKEGIPLIQWIEENSKKFRNLIVANKDLCELFLSDKNQAVTKAEILLAKSKNKH